MKSIYFVIYNAETDSKEESRLNERLNIMVSNIEKIIYGKLPENTIVWMPWDFEYNKNKSVFQLLDEKFNFAFSSQGKSFTEGTFLPECWLWSKEKENPVIIVLAEKEILAAYIKSIYRFKRKKSCIQFPEQFVYKISYEKGWTGQGLIFYESGFLYSEFENKLE